MNNNERDCVKIRSEKIPLAQSISCAEAMTTPLLPKDKEKRNNETEDLDLISN